MKAQLRKLARVMAGWPLIGRVVRIGVAVIRLPETRADYLALREQLPPALQTLSELDHRHSELDHRQQVFATQQLPSLLEALSEVNHRQHSRSKELDNFIKSVPVALRNFARDLASMREGLADTKTNLGEANARLDSTIARVDDTGAFMDTAGVRLDAADTRIGDALAQLENISGSVGYLLGRVEFVRRELMFEMRYGGSTRSGGDDQFKAKTEIIAPDKLAAAQRDRVRLNLGCGHVPLDGYLNVDRRAVPGVDIVAEVDGLPFEENEVDEIFSAHLLEHFPQEQLRRELLGYWRGLLKPGGEFGAVVPDADGMVKAYASQEYDFERLREVTFGGQDYDGDFHYNMLTPASLSDLLAEARFTDIRIIAANRENGGCKEFEIRAKRT